MKTFSPLILLFAAVLLTSCDRQVQRLLTEAETYLPQHADSADAVLSQIAPEWRTLGQGNKAHYGLLQTKTNALLGRGVGSDSLIRQSYSYYHSKLWTNGNTPTDILRQCGQSAFYFAQFHIQLDSTKNAEDLLRHAIRYSEQAADWRTCYMAYQYLGTLVKRSNQSGSINLLKKSLYIYNRCNDKPTNLLSICLDLGYGYTAESEFDSASVYFDRAMLIADDIDSDEKRCEVYRALSSLHFYQHDYRQALHYARLGQQHLTPSTHDASRFLMAETYLYCDSLAEAKQIFTDLRLSKQTMIAYEAYRYLSQIAALEGDDLQAVAYSDSAITASETMYFDALSQKDLYYHDLLHNEMQNEQLRYRQRLYTYGIISIVILAAIIFYFSYRRVRIYIRRINAKRKIGIQTQRTTLKQVKTLQEEVKDSKNTIRQMQHITMEDSRIYQQIKSGALKSIDMTPARWLQVEQLLDSCSSHFVSRLKLQYPTISQQQLELCMLSRIGLTQNELAAFYIRSVEAIKSRRKKLKAEIFNDKGSNISVDDIIAEF